MGMVNQLGRFTPNLAEHSKPIRDLLQKESSWIWEAPQIQAFDRIKKELSSTPLLALYDPKARTKISADASSFGLGAVLLQCPKGSEESEDVWKPVAYASRAMSSTEQRYAQVEKEALAVTWACEKFADFVIGMTFLIETDHKPLVSLLGTKAMSDLPPRIQRFRMRLARYHYEIKHVPGKFLYTADTLSRAPLQSMTPEEEDFESDVEAFVDSVVMSLPASETRLEELRKAIHKDSVLLSVITKYCQEGWPGFEKPSINVVTRPYWQIREEITLCQELLMRGNRLIIPTYLRAEILQRIHEGHQGIVKCCERARNSVWWPRINREIEDLVRNCTICVKQKADHAEPLRPTPFPERPWQKVGSDLFQIKNVIYLLVIDYFSRYIEIALLKSTSSQAVINHMQSIFARHGIPETVVSDNGPQYASEAFVKFAKDYGFCHETSSPYYPQGNTEAERAVQTIKRAIRNASDPYQALLAYRATPLKCGYSPAELLMGRRLRTTLPENPQNFTPKWPDLAQIRERETRERETQKKNFDCSHQARSLPKLQPGQAVWVRGPGGGFGGTVTSSAGSDRSYVIETPTGQVRRNRRHLVSAPMLIPENPQVEDHDDHEKTVNSSSVRESLKTVTPKITVQTETLSPENIVQTHDQNTRTSSSTPVLHVLQFLARDDEVCHNGSYPKFPYYPGVIGQTSSQLQPSCVPGFYIGDPCEFGLVSILNTNTSKMKQFERDYGPESAGLNKLGMGLSASFSWLLAQAHYQGFNSLLDLTNPLTTQTVLTDGQKFLFLAYQLNTLHLWKDDNGNPLRNVCWISKEQKLYEMQDGQISEFNVDVLKQLIKCLVLKPVDRESVREPSLLQISSSVEHIVQKRTIIIEEEEIKYDATR
ncbi:hypothetical protein ScPMuIL_017847 [Solemya velum]